MIGKTTMTETVMRIDVGVCVVAAEAMLESDPDVFLTICATSEVW